MKHRKPSSKLNDTPSYLNRRLKTLKISAYNADIDELIVLAEEKIAPILRILTDNPSGAAHYIQVKDCSRIEEFWNITKDLIIALENIGFQVNTRLRAFNLQKYKDNADSKGLIYVDTTLLLNIIELYNTLQSLKEELEAFYRSIGIHSFVQTESGVISVTSAESANPHKIVFKLQKPTAKGNSAFGLLSSDFFIMPSSTNTFVPLSASKSEVVEGSFVDVKDSSIIRKVRSASSVEDQIDYGVNDVYGARKIIVRCIGDLQDVSNYLGTPRKDVSTVCALLEANNAGPTGSIAGPGGPIAGPGSSNTGPRGSGTASKAAADNIDSKGNCCCKDCFADSDAVRPECEDDQVIICIKGCNEEEGDVQIVIRQCPDCKKGEKNERSPSSEPSPSTTQTRDRLTNTDSKRSMPTETADARRANNKSVSMRSPVYDHSSTPSIHSDKYVGPREIESTILHNIDSRGSIVCSDEEDERDMQTTAMVDCSKIHMFETTNLCLKTETGQELIISLTVTPKDLAPRLSIRDIFSEDLERKSSARTKVQPNYYVADRYIPLGRTKVCSSLDFDVGTADSKLRGQGIKHKDNKIVVQLESFGADNLLRACRPAKCCRKAILNEKMKKCLPYAASIRSLPLDDEDMQVINQSLEMSLQKVKNSIDIKKDYYTKQAFFVNNVKTCMYFIVEEDTPGEIDLICERSFIRAKLSYYINLVKDLPVEIKTQYDIMYFEVENQLDKVVKNTHPRIQNSNSNRESHISNNRLIKVNIAEVQSSPMNYISSFEERPLPSHQNYFYEHRPSFLKSVHKQEPPKNSAPDSRLCQKKTFVSKIPIYQGNKKDGLKTEQNWNTPGQTDLGFKSSMGSLPPLQHILETMSEDFGFSGLSLKDRFDNTSASSNDKQNKNITENIHLDLQKSGLRGKVCSQVVGKRPKLFSESFLEFLNIIPKQNKDAQEQEMNSLSPESSIGNSLKNKNIPSKSSLSSTKGRNKRKKKEFYLARSKSEISMSSLKRLTKPKKVKPLVKPITVKQAPQAQKITKETNCEKQPCKNKSETSNWSQDEEYVSKLVLNYFSKVLYKVVLQQVMKEKVDKQLSRNVLNVCIGTDRTSLQEIYRRTVKHLSRNKNTRHSYHDLKAKQSQLCIAIPFLTDQNPGNLCVFNNLALQTSIIFGDTKTCQTSETLLAYLFNSTNLQKESFIKSYYRNSQDEVDYFVNGLKSEESLSSTFSGEGLISPYLSDIITESEESDSLDQSLIQLKDTLEKYENIKHQIAQKNETVNPIDYFVYQMCACNGKINKKPSMMQKLFGKTKGLFSLGEKDLCRKYENQRKFLSMSPQDLHSHFFSAMK